MKIQKALRNLDFYLENKDIYYVERLDVQAPKLIKEAIARGFKLRGIKGRNPKGPWLLHFTLGKQCPKNRYIMLSNGTCIYNYSLFDTTEIEDEEFINNSKVKELLEKYNCPKSGVEILEQMIDKRYTKIPHELCAAQYDNRYLFWLSAFHGGANHILKKDVVIKNEIHIDFHQLYAYVMETFDFPEGTPVFKEGYVIYPHALYCIGGGRARLKKDGYPLIPSMYDNGMLGADGGWFDLVSEMSAISTPDLETLLENYEIEDLDIYQTIIYPLSFKGKDAFGNVIHELYEIRKSAMNKHEATFAKLMNEYVAGMFEKTWYMDNMWKTLDKPYSRNDVKKNPIVGIFITAYGRRMLNNLLHLFDKSKVIGYDTDCVFFEGTIKEVPIAVKRLLGPDRGQLHYDGIYANVTHKASKYYYGLDLESGHVFRKRSGFSKSGKVYVWNKEKLEYELKEM